MIPNAMHAFSRQFLVYRSRISGIEILQDTEADHRAMKLSETNLGQECKPDQGLKSKITFIHLH